MPEELYLVIGKMIHTRVPYGPAFHVWEVATFTDELSACDRAKSLYNLVRGVQARLEAKYSSHSVVGPIFERYINNHPEGDPNLCYYRIGSSFEYEVLEIPSPED